MGKATPLSFLILFLLVCAGASAQFLPVSANGKCEMSEVVMADGLPKAMLYANQVKWIRNLPRSDGKLTAVRKDSAEGKTSGDFEMLVYAQSGILKKIAGSISYHFFVEAKEGKYRFSFTDFVFHFYTQNRNYQFVKTGKTKPLEESEAQGWQKLWTDHRKAALNQVSSQIDELKLKIIETTKEVNAKADEKKVEW